jgi:hypothetical protein
VEDFFYFSYGFYTKNIKVFFPKNVFSHENGEISNQNSTFSGTAYSHGGCSSQTRDQSY